MKIENSIWVLFFLILYGCVRTEEIGTPWSSEPYPVVFSVLSVDRVPGVFLGQTYYPDMQQSGFPYPEAKVFMAGEDMSWIELERDSAGSQYFVDKNEAIVLMKGKSYFIRIEIDNLLLEAQTSIPSATGSILDATCVLAPKTPNYTIGWGDYDEVFKATIRATLQLPSDPAFGCYLSTNFYIYVTEIFQESENYISQDTFIPKDSTIVDLSIRTVTPELKKFIMARRLSVSYDDAIVPEILMGTFSGVLPVYNNINGAIGFFGAYWEESVSIPVQQP